MGTACIISVSTDPDSHFIYFDDMPTDIFHGKSLHLRRIRDSQWLTNDGWNSFAKAIPFEIIRRDDKSSMIRLEKKTVSGIRFGDGIELYFDNVAPIRLRWNKGIDLDAYTNFKRNRDLISDDVISDEVSNANQSEQANCNNDVKIDPVETVDDMASGYEPCNEQVSSAKERELPPEPTSAEIALEHCVSSTVITAENYERRLRAIELLAQEFDAGQITDSEFQERKREIRAKIF